MINFWGVQALVWSYTVAYYLLDIYLLLLLARAVLSWVTLFNPLWRPRNTVVLTLLNLVYMLTDPPLRFLARFLRPVRIGAVSLDLSFLVLVGAIIVLQRLLGIIFYWLLF